MYLTHGGQLEYSALRTNFPQNGIFGKLLRLIANDGLRMVVVGLALGLGTALAGSRMLKALLFQVSAYDPLTYIVVPLLLSLVALIAILIPARAGMGVEPAVALRAE